MTQYFEPGNPAQNIASAGGMHSIGHLPDFTLLYKYDRLVRMTPLTKHQVFEIIGYLEPEIRALGVSRLAVFGSVARGESGPDSDVDVLVQFLPGSKTFERFLALSELLEAKLDRRVELVTTEALSPFFGSHILAEAQDVIRTT
jgi:predicted nucleotidyltransferase